MARTGVKVDLDVGDLVANAGRAKGAISAIGEAMKKAESEGRFGDYGKLAYEKQRMQGRADGFERSVYSFANNQKLQGIGTNGLPALKLDQEYASLIKNQTEAIRKLTEQYEEKLQAGKLDEARALSPQIDQQQKEFQKLIEQTTPSAGNRVGVGGAVNAIGFHQIAGAINDGFSRFAGSINRSGIISQYGSGDILGAHVSEKRRQTNLLAGGIEVASGLVGAIIGSIVKPGLGTAMGAAGGHQAGRAISTALGIQVDKAENNTAYSRLWMERSPAAMELAALRGIPQEVRESFDMAASAAREFGYSAEEGMDAMKQAVRQGLGKEAIDAVTRQVFQFERGTGADRGTMLSLASMSERYGGGNALGAGWAGLQASGMRTGQASEFFRSMQRIMEDGISRGFVRSSDQVARNLTMLAKMTGNNPLWQGERGAQRLSEMNAGIEQATGLQSSSDIVAFRAAMNIAREGNEDAHWVHAMKVMERGFTPELFNEFMSLTSNIEGAGNKGGIISRMVQTFGLSYTNAYKLFRGWNPNMSTDSLNALVEQHRDNPLPDPSSPELSAAITTQEIIAEKMRIGKVYWDENVPGILNERLANIRGDGGASPYEAQMVAEELRRRALENNNPYDFSPIDRANNFIGEAMDGLFSPSWLGLDRDAIAQRNIKGIIRGGLLSEDDNRFQMAVDAIDIFRSLPDDIRREMNANNTVNALANARGIEQLLRELIELTRNSEITINVP
jgi:hypothetical protein